MASQGDEPPTIEQSSYFSAKRKDGETIEFETTLKIFTKPSLDDTWDIDYQGAKDSERKPERIVVEEESKPRPTDSEPGTTETTIPSEITPGESTPRNDSFGMVEDDPSPKADFGIDKDKKIDNSSPSSTDKKLDKSTDSDDRPSSFFIPDPCEAIDNLEKSIKNYFSNKFSS